MDELEFYAAPGRHTDLSRHAVLIDALPCDAASVARVVQGLILHPMWAQRYGVELTPDRGPELQLRAADRMVDRILELDDSPLDHQRDVTERLVGNCRDFTTLSCAIMRHHGVAVRARCGFATYFNPGSFEDHWIVEELRNGDWARFDPQLDAFQIGELGVAFDPQDMPGDAFYDAGSAWQMVRAGDADPELFGIMTMRGAHMVRSNTLLDLAALNKVELLPWDSWGLLQAGTQGQPDDDVAVDGIAAVAARGRLDQVRELYENDERLLVGDQIVSYTPDGPQLVTL